MISFGFRAPEDGYYMFTVVVREDGDVNCAGSIVRTPASDPNNEIMLCRAEMGDFAWLTGSCTVRTPFTSKGAEKKRRN